MIFIQTEHGTLKFTLREGVSIFQVIALLQSLGFLASEAPEEILMDGGTY